MKSTGSPRSSNGGKGMSAAGTGTGVFWAELASLPGLTLDPQSGEQHVERPSKRRTNADDSDSMAATTPTVIKTIPPPTTRTHRSSPTCERHSELETRISPHNKSRSSVRQTIFEVQPSLAANGTKAFAPRESRHPTNASSNARKADMPNAARPPHCCARRPVKQRR